MDQAILVLIGLGVIIAVVVSANRHPLRQCPKCRGTGKIRSWWIPGRYRPCPRCGRAGEIRGPLGRKDD